jgi:hypothetical protein
MEHIKALAVKFVISVLILFIILGAFYQFAFGDILVISIAMVGIAYVIGDMLVLAKFGNIVATIGDFGLSFVTIYFMGSQLFRIDAPIFVASLITALLIAGGEWFFHKYLNKHVLSHRPGFYARTDMMAEFAEENDLGDLYDPESAPHEKDYSAEKTEEPMFNKKK